MKTNQIIKELRIVAGFDWGAKHKAYWETMVKDAHVVECVPMSEVFNPEQLDFLREFYEAKPKHCYSNSSKFVKLMSPPLSRGLFTEPVRYVEGFTCDDYLFPIEHGFVKFGDKYIDPTFELALKLDVRKEQYVSIIELEPAIMIKYELETGCYGELYKYDYYCKHDPGMAERIRSINPNRDKKKPRLV
jgi:hypothetical protein